MAKGYWITVYRSISDPARFAEYAALAGPAIEGGGGRFVARGAPAKTFEGTENQRAVVIEFESVAHAIDSAAMASTASRRKFERLFVLMLSRVLRIRSRK